MAYHIYIVKGMMKMCGAKDYIQADHPLALYVYFARYVHILNFAVTFQPSETAWEPLNI